MPSFVTASIEKVQLDQTVDREERLRVIKNSAGIAFFGKRDLFSRLSTAQVGQ